MRRREGLHGLANLVRVCRSCHHERIHANPEWAMKNGLTVPTWVGRENIWRVPIKTWRGWLTLKDDGFPLIDFHVGESIQDALDYYHLREEA